MLALKEDNFFEIHEVSLMLMSFDLGKFYAVYCIFRTSIGTMDGSVCKSACRASMRAWVQISGTHVRSPQWSEEPQHPPILWSQNAVPYWLPSQLQVQGQALSSELKEENDETGHDIPFFGLCAHTVAHVNTDTHTHTTKCTFSYISL